MLLEALEMKPPIRVESELAKNDEEALRLPETLREEPMELEAVEMNPPVIVTGIPERPIVTAVALVVPMDIVPAVPTEAPASIVIFPDDVIAPLAV